MNSMNVGRMKPKATTYIALQSGRVGRAGRESGAVIGMR
jgi:hypothetical protein